MAQSKYQAPVTVREFQRTKLEFLLALEDKSFRANPLQNAEGVLLADYSSWAIIWYMISFDDFVKLEIRIGKIISAERIENSDKLLRLEVDFGEAGKRQIVSGIAEYFAPEALINKEAAFVVNMEPRVLRGVESSGMILAMRANEKVVLLKPEEEVPPGSVVK